MLLSIRKFLLTNAVSLPNGAFRSESKNSLQLSCLDSTSSSLQIWSTFSMSASSNSSLVVSQILTLTTGRNTLIIVDTPSPTRLSSISGSVSDPGMPNRSLVSYNLLPERPEFRSMVSRIYRVVMVLEDLPLKRQERLASYPRVILGKFQNPSCLSWNELLTYEIASIVSIYHRIRVLNS